MQTPCKQTLTVFGRSLLRTQDFRTVHIWILEKVERGLGAGTPCRQCREARRQLQRVWGRGGGRGMWGRLPALTLGTEAWLRNEWQLWKVLLNTGLHNQNGVSGA